MRPGGAKGTRWTTGDAEPPEVDQCGICEVSIGNNLIVKPAPCLLGEGCEHGARPVIESFCTGAGRAAANVLGLPGPHYLVAGDGGKLQKKGYNEGHRRLLVEQRFRGEKTIGRGRWNGPRGRRRLSGSRRARFGSRWSAASSRRKPGLKKLGPTGRGIPGRASGTTHKFSRFRAAAETGFFSDGTE